MNPAPVIALPERVRNICDQVARKHGVLSAEIRGGGGRRRTTAKIAAARREVIHRMKEDLGYLSASLIGRVLGLHHTTVLYALGKTPSLLTEPARQAKRQEALARPIADIPVPDLSGEWAI